MDLLQQESCSLSELPALRVLEGLAQLHQAVLLLDAEGRIAWMSDAFGVLCGVASHRVGAAYKDLLANPEQEDSIRKGLDEWGRIANERVLLRRDNGSTIPVEVSVARLPGAAAGLADARYLAVVRSLAERERVDRELRHTIDYLAAVLDSSPEAVVAVDRSGLVTYANPAVQRLLGHCAEDVLDRPISLFLRNAADFERMACALRPAGEVHVADVEVRRKDESAICVSVSASPLCLPDGRQVGAVAFLHDVTDRRRFEAELARKNQELESYVHSVSHDLRSPLVSLLGFSRLLRQDFGDVLGDSGRHFLDRIEQAGRTMETLINDLLELSKIGQTGERKALVDPLKILLQLKAELKPRLEGRNIRLSVPENPPLVLCDRTRLYQVFSNLIGNALDYMGNVPNPRIEVEIVEEGDAHRVTVRDNGRGIDPAHHERIFEIFQSLGPRVDGRRGTGVGLAIVKKIAETHGGRVWVESRPGHGAAFHLRLPNR